MARYAKTNSTKMASKKRGQLKFILISVIIALVVLGILLGIGLKVRRGERIIGEQFPETCPYYGKSTEEFQMTIMENLGKKREQEAYKWYKRFLECQEDGYLIGEKIAPLEETLLTQTILTKFVQDYEDETKA